MSCFGPVSAGRSPVFVRPTTGAVSRHLCGFGYCCLSSACVLVPGLREVVLRTWLPRGEHPWVSRCGLMAIAALPRGAYTFCARLYQGSLAFAVGFGCCSRYRLVALLVASD
jgi:hypothetical protein